ncbi:phage tail protein, partial [Pseudomonas sp. NPDC089554]|uniref:phage tail protein n=1 Tax=Pseudomonas sp. NPDC089554 TaxID=3390653 RepID=UPI003D011403
MQKISDSTSTATPAGEFTKGSVAGGVPATIITDEWLNSVQREQLSILDAAGVVPDKDDDAQMLEALRVLFAQGTHTHSLSDIEGKKFANFGMWAWASSISNDPGQGRVALNNADLNLATQLRISEASSDGEDYSQCLSLLRSGDTITLQDQSGVLAHRFRVTNSAIDNGPYRSVSVRYLSGMGGLPGANAAVSVLLTLAGASDDGVPVGSIMPFPKATVPAGYLELDGSVQNGATYPDLFAYLGTSFNTGGEPAGFFRLPDARGEFLRGWDHGRGIDVGRALGTYQADEFKSHTHAQQAKTILGQSSGIGINSGVSPYSEGGVTQATGGVETRPRNLAVMLCIKAWSAPANQANIDVAALATEVGQLREAPLIGTWQGLKVSATGASPSLTVVADQLMVGNAAQAKKLASINLTIDSSKVGANGFDVGVIPVNAWCSVWVIWGGSVGVAGLLSLSATNPSL